MIRYADRHLAVLNVHYRVMRSMRGKPLSQYTEVSPKNDGGIHVVLVQDVQTGSRRFQSRLMTGGSRAVHIAPTFSWTFCQHCVLTPHIGLKPIMVSLGILLTITIPLYARGVSTLSLCHTCVAHGFEWYTHQPARYRTWLLLRISFDGGS
jgi:hypothetical protein